MSICSECLSKWQVPHSTESAAAFDVSRATLTRRHRNRADRPIYNQTRQKLTAVEEEVLVNYIRRQTTAGYPISVETLRQLANVILQQRLPAGSPLPSGDRVGMNWTTKFYARHPNVQAVKIQAIDALRFRASTYDRLLEWWQQRLLFDQKYAHITSTTWTRLA